ncbi:unnamed protein product, partial [Hymenolepis diminuta]
VVFSVTVVRNVVCCRPFPPRSVPSVPNGLPNGGMRNDSVISNGIHSQFPSFENWFDEASLSRMSLSSSLQIL